MSRSKIICVGDVHGMLDEFIELVELAEYNQEEDRLICVGDLMDRGPKSAGVVTYAQKIGAELCIGNHDDKYIRYYRHEQKKTHVGRKHYRNPIRLSEEKQKIWESFSQENIMYLLSGKYCIPIWEYNSLVVHAGVLPGTKPWDKRDREEYIFTRYIDKDTFKQRALGPNFSKPSNSVHWTEVYNGCVNIIYGHEPKSFDAPVVEHNAQGATMIGLDTGSCFGGKLSCLVLTPENPKGVFRSVKAKKCWMKFQFANRNEQTGK